MTTFEYLNTSLRCQEIQNNSVRVTRNRNSANSIEMYEAVIIILVTGFFAFMLAWLFTYMRKHIYKDSDNLDTSFDAGGNVNAGLTATTVVSQWTWAATLLQSSTVATKYGISGSLWYAAGASIQILLFSMLSIHLKTRAPGAKTFLQVIRARFGKRTHVVFCCFALATNVIVTAMLMLGGSAVITSLVRYISVEYAVTLVTAIIGGYTFIGGLGATFYVSYFNTAIIYVVLLVFIFRVYEQGGDILAVGSIERVYDYVSCAKGPTGNKDFSYLTILSDQGLMFGLINIVGNFGTVFVDQSYWQSSVAAKPRQGVIGFLLGGLAWFAIPFSLSTTMGLAYVALSAYQGEHLLTLDQVNAGLVPPTVAYHLLGRSGAVIVLVMVLMAITSTGSAEVMAVTSIMVYDIYGLYLKPYRLTNDVNSCLLCGKGRGRMANPRDKCKCVSMLFCKHCHQDSKNRQECRRAIKPEYKCQTHGAYRFYNDYLASLKSWALVWVTLAIVPLTIALYMTEVGLDWVYLFMGVLVGSAVVPITLCMFWERLTGKGMVAGAIGGTISAVIVWLSVASTYDGGLSDFRANTGREAVMLSGNLVAILGSGVITLVVSLITGSGIGTTESEEIWENTRDIDNPLSPWVEKYRKELNLTDTRRLDNRPSLQDVQKAFKRTYILAYCMSLVLSLFLVIVWPSIMVAIEVMNLAQFTGWVKISEVWAFLAALLMMILPLCNEFVDVYTVIAQFKKVDHADFEDDGDTDRKQSSSSHKKSVCGNKEKLHIEKTLDEETPGSTVYTISSSDFRKTSATDGQYATTNNSTSLLPPIKTATPSLVVSHPQDGSNGTSQPEVPNRPQLMSSTLPSTFIDLGPIEHAQSRGLHAHKPVTSLGVTDDVAQQPLHPFATAESTSPVITNASATAATTTDSPTHRTHENEGKPTSPVQSMGPKAKYFSDIQKVESTEAPSIGPNEHLQEFNDNSDLLF